MTDCIICKQIQENSGRIIYKNEEFAVFVSQDSCTMGHLQLFPIQHFTILEQVPGKVAGKLFVAANKISTMLFESLNAQGTNIIVQNGVSAGQNLNHFSINIIPRREKDNLNLMWTPKKAEDDELTSNLEKLNNFFILGDEPAKEEFKEESKPEIKKDDKVIRHEKERMNYLIRQLERIP